MGWKEKSLEIKVGAFLLLSVGILVGFFLLLGNFSFSEGHLLHVNLPSSGGLRQGAKVKIAGVVAGKVTDILFTGGTPAADGAPVYVQVRMEVDAEMGRSVTEGSRFFVTTEGLLGERYVEIIPGPPEAPPIPSGAVRPGDAPVELQMVTARAASMLEKVQQSLEKDGKGISALVDDARAMVEHSSNILRELDAELPVLLEESRATLARARASLDRIDGLVASGTSVIEDEDGVRTLVEHAGNVAHRLDEELPFLLGSVDELSLLARDLLIVSQSKVENLDAQVSATAKDARTLLGRAGELVKSLGGSGLALEARDAITRVTADLAATTGSVRRLSERTEETVTNLNAITTSIRQGKGTLGAFLLDREIYDDVRELILDLKKNPWKVMWKP